MFSVHHPLQLLLPHTMYSKSVLFSNSDIAVVMSLKRKKTYTTHTSNKQAFRAGISVQKLKKIWTVGRKTLIGFVKLLGIKGSYTRY